MSITKKEYNREYMKQRRIKAKEEGIILASDSWFKDNPEKHRLRTLRWRQENREASRENSRRQQAKRRSTPYGTINNRMWPSINNGIKRESAGLGKYNKILGYTWLELREHLEKQFDNTMTWDNWGKVWEIDHIKPLSSYKYESIEEDSFKECWSLDNLRPLDKLENIRKYNKVDI